jgi:hypothetical protein
MVSTTLPTSIASTIENFEKDTNSTTDDTFGNVPLSSIYQHTRRFQVFSIGRSPEYNNFQKSIKNLLALDEIDEDEIDDEDDIVKPSGYALIEAWRLLNEIRQDYFGEGFPYCSASLESRGGIHLVWDNPSFKRRVWVKIPYKSSEIDYIFFREKETSRFTKSFSLSELYRLLIWLNDGTRSIDDI